MELRRGVLALCLLCIIPVGTAEPQVLVSIPSLLKSGEKEKACLTVKRHTDPVDVQVTLEVDGQNHTIINEQIPPGDIFKSYEIQVPEIETKTPVFLSVYAVSTNYNYTTRRSVVIASAGNVAFIRTDKELYKGGQEVRMYLLSLDNNLLAVNEMFPVIYVLDPKGIRLHQWLNQSTNWGFLMLSFSLLDDSDLGIYQIVAERQSGGSIDKTISVEEYALPRFSVMMKAPNTITMQDKNVSFEMSVRYTYNQGVPGKISGRMCRPPTNYYVGNGCYKNPDGICVPFTGETDSEGTFKGSVDLSTFQLDRTGYQMRFTLQATVTEQGTNVQVTETKTISVTNQLGRVYFDYKVMLPYFKKGIPYPVGIIVENGLQQPESNQVVGLQVDGKTVANMTSDENGKAEYELDTSEFSTSSVQLNLVYKDQEQCFDGNWIVPTYSTDSRTIGRFYSATNSFIQLQGPKEELQCGKTYNIRVQYSFGKDALAEGETTIKFASMVISRSKIIESGEHAVDLSNSLQGEFNLTYETSVNHVPLVQYSVHYLLKDELVGDVINLDLEKCLKNKVSANFSLETGTPGSNVSLAVSATAQSMCLARVFDSSLQLLDQGQHFSAATIYNALKFNRLTGYYAEGLDVSPPQPPCIDGDKQILFDGLYWQPANFNQEQDVSKIYGAIGLHVITHTRFQQPQLCLQPTRFTPWLERPGGGFSLAVADGASTTRETTATGTIEIATVRKDFPELWYFGSLHLGETGSTQLDLEVPGTITEWKGDLVCLSNATGIGMTKYPANFTSFQKMFVDLAYPASIVRKETMLLVASVANYMNKCAKVRVSLQNSDNYVAVPVEQDPVKCVCSQERVSFSWKINATSLGVSNITVTAETINIGETCDGPADPNEPNRKDTIIRNFNVEAEGLKQVVTKTDFVCVKGANSVVQVSINPNATIVPGSMSGKIQVIGDMVGRAVTNPEALIVEPTGCGEQNLATMMPIVHVMEFLNLTGRLTEDIKQRAIQNMAIGYVRQMRYRHSDGSFSAFGQGRSESSGWLTVLSMSTLWSMSPYTFVDRNIIVQGMIFLEKLQNMSTGAFKPVGTLFNNALKGGADDDVSFTCAVVNLLSETYYAATPSLLRPALTYLDAASRREQSLYNYAMLYKTFRLTGNEERANAMHEKLKSLAIDEGGSLHWERRSQPEQKTPFLFSPSAPSAELEITATVLEAMAHGKNSSTVSPEELNDMAKIANWIVGQQNIYGSYRTTSDTVVVLGALCAYGILVYQKDATNKVLLKRADQVLKEFVVDQASRIVLQTEVLPQVPGDYSLDVSGNGCVLVQTGVEFNIPVERESSAFSLSLTTFPENCKDGVAYTVDIQVNASYHGIQNKSNMALMNIPLFSGYSVAYDSQSKLQSQFSKAEVKNNRLFIYFDNMDSDGVSFNVTLEMGPRVENFQERTLILYDYYETDERVSSPMYHPCTSSG